MTKTEKVEMTNREGCQLMPPAWKKRMETSLNVLGENEYLCSLCGDLTPHKPGKIEHIIVY